MFAYNQNAYNLMFRLIVLEKLEEEFWGPNPHSKPALSLNHDLLGVLSMDTWWNFGHKLREKLEEKFQSFLPHSQPATAGSKSSISEKAFYPTHVYSN